jgi:hypothetical protein
VEQVANTLKRWVLRTNPKKPCAILEALQAALSLFRCEKTPPSRCFSLYGFENIPFDVLCGAMINEIGGASLGLAAFDDEVSDFVAGEARLSDPRSPGTS